jgi:CBS domain-containing protein
MRVDELMSEAECCHPGDSIREAAKMMKRENVGFLPVCDRDEKPVGALTDRDIVIRVVAEGRSTDDDVQTVMTKDVVGCRIGDDLGEVKQQMRDHQTSRVMVCDQDGKLQGVVSLQDLAEGESEHEAGQTLQEVKSDQPLH